jgi:hypothetical protein
MTTKPCLIWIARSRNDTTGDIPTAWVGPTVAAARASCAASGCPHYPPRHDASTPVRCYAWHGCPAGAFLSIIRSHEREPMTLERAIARSSRAARFARITAIGDPSAIGSIEAAHTRSLLADAGLTPIGYIAGWRLAPWWAPLLRASCFSDADEQEARAAGWLCVRIGPANLATHNPHQRFVCPHKMGEKVRCATCGLCAVHHANPETIWFPHHGSSSLAERRQA